MGFCSTFYVMAGKDLKRPKDIQVEKFDTFKNKSFDTYEKTKDLKAVVDDDKELSAEQVAGLATMKKDIEALIKKGEQILKEAKDIKPKTKSLKAITNTKKSIEALNTSLKYLNYISEKIAAK